MTDADLIKALQCCCAPWEKGHTPCDECPIPKEKIGTSEGMCDEYIMQLAADRLEELTGGNDG